MNTSLKDTEELSWASEISKPSKKGGLHAEETDRCQKNAHFKKVGLAMYAEQIQRWSFFIRIQKEKLLTINKWYT